MRLLLWDNVLRARGRKGKDRSDGANLTPGKASRKCLRRSHACSACNVAVELCKLIGEALARSAEPEIMFQIGRAITRLGEEPASSFETIHKEDSLLPEPP